MDDDILVEKIIQLHPSIRNGEGSNRSKTGVVIDGCALLHKIAWPKVGTFGSLAELFKVHVYQLKGAAVHICVVFDSYLSLTTKEPEQKHRRPVNPAHPDVKSRKEKSSTKKQDCISLQQ